MSEVKKDVLTLVFGQRSVEKWTLRSKSVSVEIISLGCVISAIKALDRKGQSADIVLGFDDLFSFVTFCHLDCNVQAVWSCEPVPNGVRLSHMSPNGDEGYPGNLKVSVTYTLFLLLGDGWPLSFLDLISLCHQEMWIQCIFKKRFKGAPDIYDHEVSISAEAYLPVDDNMIPTGEIRPVENSLFDLRKPVLLGSRLKELPGPGFDHNFCLWLPGQHKQEMKCARVVHPGTGRVLELSTTQPGVQFYTSNFLDGTVGGKEGTSYPKHSAFCLETQNWPDAVNQPQFPEALLRPGEEYTHTTRFTFSVV